MDKHGRARGALYYDRRGTLHEQPAKVVVVCCNGIGTPRLLLNSKSNLFPNGLANSSGLVGKNFMIHPFRTLEGVFEAPMDGHEGPFGIPAMSQQFYENPIRGEGSRAAIRCFWSAPSGRCTRAGQLREPSCCPWGSEH